MQDRGRLKENEGLMWALLCLQQTFPMSLSANESPQPPLSCHIHTCQFPSHLLLSSLPSQRGDQLTATSWGGPEASCPCPRALLASGLDRMERDPVIPSHSTLHAHRHAINTYKLEGGLRLNRKTVISVQFIFPFFHFFLFFLPSFP